MFEVPEAKKVRREDLGDSDGSEADGDHGMEHDEAMQARVNAQIAAALGLDYDDDDEMPAPAKKPKGEVDTDTHGSSDDHADNGDAEDEPNDAEQGYEFNLFSTGGAAGPAKVIIEDDAELLGDGAFVHPRPLSYYAAKPSSAKEKEQYSYAAVTADDVVQWSTQRSWGMELPWKVISVSATRKAKPGDKTVEILMENTDEAAAAKRKRPGKKQRVLLRQRKKTKAQAAEDAIKKQTEKEEHIKDKKKRLNRIKKLRKRAKDKEKKLAASGDADEADDASDSDGDE